MKRTFFSVGQGAFYLEQFNDVDGKNINVVYDCGSETDKIQLENRISNIFKKGETVNALIISHFHEDHINGIPKLLSHCQVKKIYLPLIASENKPLMRIALKIYKCNELNPQGAIKNLKSVNGEPEIIWIEEYDENGKNENAKIDSNERETMVIKPSGYNIMNDIVTTKRRNRGCFISEWKYIPYNFREYNRISCLLKNLKKQFGREIKKNEIENLWKDDVNGAREKIKAAYKRVPGELNTNSMTVFSGTENLNIKQHIDFMNVYFLKKDILIRIKLFEQPSGCLYMGDYAAFGKQKWETLKKAYAEYWEIIGCVQVPHHGSKHNFNEELLGLKCIYVISAGKMNKYGHPHATVLKQFLLKHIIPFIVTEDSDTEVNISVD